jgi:hypothetical protein
VGEQAQPAQPDVRAQIVPDYWFSALPKAKHQLFF